MRNIFFEESAQPDLPTLIDNAVKLLLLKDGDRDPMNHSDINCEQSMVIVQLLKSCRTALEKS